jgi:hypothetical protein
MHCVRKTIGASSFGEKQLVPVLLEKKTIGASSFNSRKIELTPILLELTPILLPGGRPREPRN